MKQKLQNESMVSVSHSIYILRKLVESKRVEWKSRESSFLGSFSIPNTCHCIIIHFLLCILFIERISTSQSVHVLTKCTSRNFVIEYSYIEFWNQFNFRLIYICTYVSTVHVIAQIQYKLFVMKCKLIQLCKYISSLNEWFSHFVVPTSNISSQIWNSIHPSMNN